MSKPRRRKFNKKHLSIAKKALREVRTLKRKTRPELKVFDIDSTVLTPTTTWSVTHVTAIPQGDNQETRDGMAVRVGFLEMRWFLAQHATPTQTLVRIVIVRDNDQVESTLPPGIDVIQGTTVVDQKNRQSLLKKRFTFYMDKVFVLTDATHPLIRGHFRKKVAFPVRWSGVNAADIDKNGVFLYTLSDQAVNKPNFQFTFRVYYTDV